MDLARRRVLDLLPDRAADSLSRWLDAHPELEIVARDRASCYAEGTSRGAPQARQVADRWHLLANLTDAMRRLVERRWRSVRDAFQVIEASEPAPQHAPLAVPQGPEEAAEPPPLPESTSRARRHARFEQVRALHAEGVGLRDLARQLGMSRNTVRRFLRAEHFPERAKRPPAPSLIAEHHAFLRQRWDEGCRGRTKLHQALIERGYTGSVTPLRRWIAWMRQSQPETTSRSPKKPAAQRLPSVRRVTWLLNGPDEDMRESQKPVLAKLLDACPQLATARSLASAFGRMIRERRADDLDDWLEDAASSGVKELEGLAWGIRRDRDAVLGALQTEWSSGQVEGQIHRLKLVKRQMYGRAGFALLRQRVLHPV